MDINKFDLKFRVWKFDKLKHSNKGKVAKAMEPVWTLIVCVDGGDYGIASWNVKPKKKQIEEAIETFKKSLLVFKRIQGARKIAYEGNYYVNTELCEGYVDYTGPRPKKYKRL